MKGLFTKVKYIKINLLNDTPIFAQAKVCKLLQNNKYNFNIIIKTYMHGH